MSTPVAMQTALNLLRPSFGGAMLLAGDEGYENARRVHNGAIDKHPAVIARCRSAQDIAAAVRFATGEGYEISVRGGGHNVAGRAVTEGGVMIDLSLMNEVRVDPAQRVAVAEGGATWKDFNAATQKHGLATTGGLVSSTGVAGLTLGGGLGWLMGVHGMAVDNLIAAEIVTADGSIVECSADLNSDLFWAIRGGGGNFGVASSLTFRLHPIGMVAGGIVAHPLASAPAMLRFFRDVTASAPDELTLFAGLLHAPDGSGHKVGAMVCFHPDAEDGMRALQPVKAFGSPIMDVVGPMPYEALNTRLDSGFPHGALNYWKSSFLTTLSDEAIASMISLFSECPAPMGSVLLEHFHGSVTRVPSAATAFPHRTPGYNLVIIAQWTDPAQTGACTAWARKVYDTMRPFMAPGRYVNYLGDDESSSAVAAAYGSTYDRLRQIKKRYDPNNVFRLNQNILPGG